MAEKADKDDRDEKDETGDEAGEEKAAAESEGEERSAKPAPKAASKRASARSARAARAQKAAAVPQGGGSLGKSVILFVVIVGGLLLGFAILGREQPAEAIRVRWTPGQTVDLEITLVRNDRQELACAATDEIAGKHCAFEAPNKPWSKGDNNDDKKLLKPYTTTDRVQFTAAGLWSEPALAPDKLPATRFNVKCKYKVDGLLKNLGVRWEQSGQWFPNNEWYAGSVSDCKIVQ
jgi:hypothetical protein